jgi:ATP-dependent DNA helicase RecG
MEPGESTDAPSGDGVVVPLRRVDHALDPLRRVLRFALEQPHAVRYLGSTAHRHVRLAVDHGLPIEIADDLLAVTADPTRLDDDAPEVRLDAIQALNAALLRVDATLGLPLPWRRGPPGRPRVVVDDVAPTPAPAPAPATSPRRDSGKEPVRAAAPEPKPTPPAPSPVATQAVLRVVDDAGLAERFAEVGIETVADLLLTPPIRHVSLGHVQGAGRALAPGPCAVGGRVQGVATVVGPTGPARTLIVVKGSASMTVEIPAAPTDGGRALPAWMWPLVAVGEKVVFVGTVVGEGDEQRLVDAELWADDGQHGVHVPEYGLEGLSEPVVRRAVFRALLEPAAIRELYPSESSAEPRTASPPALDVLKGAHLFGREAARARLALEEAFLVHLAVGWSRFLPGQERGFTHAVVHGTAARVCRGLGVSLDDAAAIAFEDVKRDLVAPTPMMRVLAGDVGAGRSLLAVLAGVMVCESRSQVLVLAPDPLMATSRYLFAEPLLREAGLVARLSIGEPSRAQKDALRRGEVNVLFGLPDILTDTSFFRRLGLVVLDEHGSGKQASAVAAALAQRGGQRPDLLVVPTVPPSVASLLQCYGAFDVTWLSRRTPWPAVRVVRPELRLEAYRDARARIAAKQQVIVVFPTVRGADAFDVAEAKKLVDALGADVLGGARVGLFHGSLPREDALSVIDDFGHHRVDALVCTTVVEDGPSVGRLGLVIVEQADRMPIDRMRRLAGFGVRASGAVTFVLGEGAGDDALAQVERAVDRAAVPQPDDEATSDDAPTLRWLDPAKDLSTLLSGRSAAFRTLAADPGLRRPEHAELARVVRGRWGTVSEAPCPLPDAPDAVRVKTGKKRRRRRR